MARISDETRTRNEQAIRAAMDRLLRGELPPGGKADLKTLAAEAGVTRTGFYPKKNRDGTTRPGPYQHLAEEFEQRLKTLRESGAVPDLRVAQIERLKVEVAELKARVARRDETITSLKEFQQTALSRLAAQYEEIRRLRAQAAAGDAVIALPRTRTSGPTGTHM
ncbi:hypothetical protein [Streptomyces sp. H036]|uniref:hypothetical protein n=1 Tax=Streptomyces sp. H036 TaxID=1519487 RepID=UPI0006B01F79|nr:hypothetical protein [Streptomyces sp. H036]KOV36716.1 hypothetical protein ADK98_38700 [Streptomyces sp. H036]